MRLYLFIHIYFSNHGLNKLTMNAIIRANVTIGAVNSLTNNASKGPKIIPKIVPIIENINPIIIPNIVRKQVGRDGLSRIDIFNSDK